MLIGNEAKVTPTPLLEANAILEAKAMLFLVSIWISIPPIK